jgi:hypothetical protein
MASHLVIIVDTENHSIADLNERVNLGADKPHESIRACRDYLDAVLSGAVNADVEITTRDTEPAVSTSGSGSVQVQIALK